MDKPFLVTMGDPAGIGPEIIVKALFSGALDKYADRLLVGGDVAVLQRAAGLAGYTPVTTAGSAEKIALTYGKRTMWVQPLSHLELDATPFGRISAANGRAMLDYIEWACAQCQAGDAAGMITAPIQKEAIHAAGCEFPGHTELLARRCGVEKVVMMLAGPQLKVCLVTTHLALKDVPAMLTRTEVETTLRVTAAALRQYFCPDAPPRIAVLALNPHAGEGGMFGNEEEHIIAPAIAQAQQEGILASGPTVRIPCFILRSRVHMTRWCACTMIRG